MGKADWDGGFIGGAISVSTLVQAVDNVSSSLSGSAMIMPVAGYHVTASVRSNGQFGPFEADSNGNLLESLGTKLAGEDLVVDVIKVEQRFSYTNITTQATTTVKSSAGFLHLVTVNTPATGAVVTVYDNTAGSGAKIGTMSFPLTLATASLGPMTLKFDVVFNTGLTFVTSGPGSNDLTVSWR